MKKKRRRMTRCGDDGDATGCYRVRRVVHVPVQRDSPPRPVKPGLHLGQGGVIVVVVVVIVVVGRQHA